MNEKNKPPAKYDVIVIGGGAAGMMAASVAAKNGASVLLVEKNKRLGEKLAITGGGRCNILNAEEDTRTLLANYGKADKFLHSAFSRFGVADTIAYFATLGIEIKVEARKRAFPVSESAKDVVEALYEDLKKQGVTILTETEVKNIEVSKGAITDIKTQKATYKARGYILATGGMSRPETGSTGDGFGWLIEQGHKVNEPTPNVTPLSVREKWVEDISGTTLNSVDVIFSSNSVRNFKVHGDLLFTHFGISGPVILNNAYRVAELLEQGDVTASIDCFPKLNDKELDFKIQEILQLHPAKDLKNTIAYIAPQGLSKLLAKLLSEEIDLSINNSEQSKDSRQKIVKLLKGLPLTIDNLMGFDKAVVADGGVSLTDIDTRTMQSKKVANLYIVGDLLDINRPSGGYSLQLCWTSGHIAGADAASSLGWED